MKYLLILTALFFVGCAQDSSSSDSLANKTIPYYPDYNDYPEEGTCESKGVVYPRCVFDGTNCRDACGENKSGLHCAVIDGVTYGMFSRPQIINIQGNLIPVDKLTIVDPNSCYRSKPYPQEICRLYKNEYPQLFYWCQ